MNINDDIRPQYIIITRQLNYRFMCEIMTWSDDENKIDTQKHFNKTTITNS